MNVSYLAGCLALTAAAASVQGEHLFVLKSAEGRLVVEKVELADGQEQSFSCDEASGVVDVIFPVGPGGSGSLARRSDQRTISVRRNGNDISVLDRAGNGKQWQRPTRSLDDLSTQDIRISVISHEGLRRAFLIRNYAEVAPDPVEFVVDMFAGKVPTQPGDFVIHTETYRSKLIDPIEGSLPIEYNKYLYTTGTLDGGRTGTFVVDLGAGQTFVARDFLPPDAEISDVGVAQYSAAGKEILKYAPQGATGVTTVLGSARLSTLSLGGLKYKDVEVAVMPKLPELGERRIDGIIGLDLLRRNRFLAIEFGAAGAREGTLRLGSKQSGWAAGGQAVPFALINSHLVVPAKVNTKQVAFIVDTGAPLCVLDENAAKATGVKSEESPTKSVSGVGAGSVSVHQGRMAELRLGDFTSKDVDSMVGALPIFAQLRVHNQSVGLFGNSIISRLGRLEIDFLENQIRFPE